MRVLHPTVTPSCRARCRPACGVKSSPARTSRARSKRQPWPPSTLDASGARPACIRTMLKRITRRAARNGWLCCGCPKWWPSGNADSTTTGTWSPRSVQREAFHAQLAIAVETRKPVFLHQRDAHEDFSAILREFAGAFTGGVAHRFTGGVVELDTFLQLGLFIGITGWACDERRGIELRKAIPRIPADRLLLETDAPHLLPRILRPSPRHAATSRASCRTLPRRSRPCGENRSKPSPARPPATPKRCLILKIRKQMRTGPQLRNEPVP